MPSAVPRTRTSAGCPSDRLVPVASVGVLLSSELHHLLTVERGWSERQYEIWVIDLLDHDLLG